MVGNFTNSAHLSLAEHCREWFDFGNVQKGNDCRMTSLGIFRDHETR